MRERDEGEEREMMRMREKRERNDEGERVFLSQEENAGKSQTNI